MPSDAEKRSMKTVVDVIQGKGGGGKFIPNTMDAIVSAVSLGLVATNRYPRLSVESIGNKTKFYSNNDFSCIDVTRSYNLKANSHSRVRD